MFIFFDNAAPGYQGIAKHGSVSIYFSSARSTADEAIHRYLISHRHETGNMTVVSSDHQVQQDARSLKARILSSEVFAQQIKELLDNTEKGFTDPPDALLSPGEVAEWEKIFIGYNNETKL